jgi:hypothetical protein
MGQASSAPETTAVSFVNSLLFKRLKLAYVRRTLNANVIIAKKSSTITTAEKVFLNKSLSPFQPVNNRTDQTIKPSESSSVTFAVEQSSSPRK